MRVTFNTQADELAKARGTLESVAAERATLAARLDAQQLLLADYRGRLGIAAGAE
ncbi:hypothetical protein [Burkholderia sp. Ac-20353]|uniref:hypothetical protein n=1 Tax=Burkholderia sp. Ac-20353 TaxID=2703894 RepID=UPI00197C99C3|nr:hypothetical protein [Burkholderia sp. Ac-20353]MBN3786489.1 hypothetical protein [Burkholderia sp. Ac-20353]